MSRILGLVAVVLMTGCATHVQPPQPQAWSYERMKNFRVSNSDCPRASDIITELDTQLQIKGLYGKRPEDIQNPLDLAYNQYAHNAQWALIIGCKNFGVLR